MEKAYPGSWLNPMIKHFLSTICEQPMIVGGSELKGVMMQLVLEDRSGLREIMAVEVGYSIGKTFVSMSGAYNKGRSGAGSYHLFMLRAVLRWRGYRLWDLGMLMDYKKSIQDKVFTR